MGLRDHDLKRRFCRPVFLLGLALFLSASPVLAQPTLGRRFDIEGITYVGFGKNTWTLPANAGKVPFIRDVGANWVMLDSFIHIDQSTGKFFIVDSTYAFPTMAAALQQARAQGLHIAIYVHVLNQNGVTIWQPWSPPNPAQFFADYKTFVLDHARVGQEGGAELIVIGGEMNSVYGPEYRQYWADIITSVRGIFSGTVTTGFLANAIVPPTTIDGLNQVLSFWDLLDLVGLSVYFQLSRSSDTPTVEEAIGAWDHNIFNGKNVVANLKTYNTLTGKRVLFTEIGYASVQGAATAPGSGGQAGPGVDFQAQANLYTAAFRVLTQEAGPWLAGMFLWGGVQAVGYGGAQPFGDPNYYTVDQPFVFGWRRQYDFDPNLVTGERKPAENVVRQWFGERTPRITVATNQTTYHGGDRMAVTVQTNPNGSGDDRWYLVVALKTPVNTTDNPAFIYRFDPSVQFVPYNMTRPPSLSDISARPLQGVRSESIAVLDMVVPFGLPPGSYQWVGTLVSEDLSRVLDLGVAGFTAN